MNLNRSVSRLAALTFILFLSIGPFLGAVVRAQDSGPNAPSPALTAGDVIAQGVDTAPAGQVAWRLVRNYAEPVGQAEAGERPLGFVVAQDNALLITDETNGSRTRLAAGEAAFVANGTVDRRESLGDGEAAYLRFALVPVEAVQETSGGDMIFAGEGFAAPQGDRDFDLVSLRLASGQVEHVTSEFPTLVYVLDGDVEAAADGTGEATPLSAGGAAVFNGGVSVSAEVGAHVLVAVIGPEIPSVPSADVVESTPAATQATAESEPAAVEATGKIVVSSVFCPPGVTVEQAMDTVNADPCFGGAPVEGMLVTAVGDHGTYAQANIGANGAAVIEGLPADNYQLIFSDPDGMGPTMGVCGGQDGSSGLPVVTMTGSSVELNLPAGAEYDCITKTLQPDTGGEDGDSATPTGQIVIYSELCPPGVTVEQALDSSNGDPCFGGAPVEGMLVTVLGDQGTSYQANVGANGMAIVSDLPADNYQVIFSDPEGLGPTVGFCGGQDSSASLPVVTMLASSVVLQLPADTEYDCIVRTIQPGEAAGQAIPAETVEAPAPVETVEPTPDELGG